MSLSLSHQKSLTDTIAAKLRTAIIEGELSFGEKLSEQMLADRFRISRSPVRDALALLQLEGLVVVYVKRGTYVISPMSETVADQCEFRAELESLALNLAMRKEPGALNSPLRKVLSGMKAALAAGETRQYGRLDTSFHDTIVRASQNQSLIKAYAQMIGPLRALRNALLSEGVPDAALDEHRQIVDLIGAGEVHRACELLSLHAQNIQGAYRAARLAGKANW